MIAAIWMTVFLAAEAHPPSWADLTNDNYPATFPPPEEESVVLQLHLKGFTTGEATVEVIAKNGTKRPIVLAPNQVPGVDLWWSPFLLFQTFTPTTQGRSAPKGGRFEERYLPCPKQPLGPVESIRIRPGESATLFSGAIPLASNLDVVLIRAEYRTVRAPPKCDSFVRQWRNVTQLSLSSNYVVVVKHATK